ncbi:MAG: hypothetical protein FWE18_03710 [Alphaproteobacteria bacterium]|nr:hypothetical protein [Alphaproteobacteria bacterium]
MDEEELKTTEEATPDGGVETTESETAQAPEDGNPDFSDLEALFTDEQFPMLLQELRVIQQGLGLPNMKSVFLYMFMLVDTIASSHELAQMVMLQSKHVDGVITPEEIHKLAGAGDAEDMLDGGKDEASEGEGEGGNSPFPNMADSIAQDVKAGIQAGADGLTGTGEAAPNQVAPTNQSAPAAAPTDSKDRITIKTIAVDGGGGDNKEETMSDFIKRKKGEMGVQ